MTVSRAPGARRALLGLAAFLVACVWLNQSVGRPAFESLPDRVSADPMGNLFELLRYPFTRLYRRSGDEALYYWTAARLLGRPHDNDAPGHTRGHVPPWF